MDHSFQGLVSREALVGLFWGSSGGAIVSIVTRTPLVETAGRIIVGGIVAAAGAPYLAHDILKMDPSSAPYPFVCCSIGVLGYQLVKSAIDDPSRIPILGRMLTAPQTVGGTAPPAQPAQAGLAPPPPPRVGARPVVPPPLVVLPEWETEVIQEGKPGIKVPRM